MAREVTIVVRIISALILAVTATCCVAADPLDLVDNPPDRHIVVRGDTLWGISGKFLKQPWRWPEIWQLNRDQIRNPHLIYPGDVIMLDLSEGSPRLRLGKPLTTKLQPSAYSEPVQQVVPSIPPNVIEPFTSQPRIVQNSDIEAAIRIVATPENRVLVGSGDTFYARGIPDAQVEQWHVFRPSKPLKDPETGQVIAHESFFLGNASLVKPGEPATLRVTLAKQEISRGDYLLPAPPAQIIAYAPHRPESEIAARVMSMYGGLTEGGPQSIIVINRGSSDDLEIGHVLALFRKHVAVGIDQDGRRTSMPLPEERYGLAFVFRVFERVAYALVVEASRSVIVGDAARNP